MPNTTEDTIEDTTHDTKSRIPKWAKILLVLFPVIVIGAHGGYWYLVTSQSLVQIENWAEEQRAQGLAISYGEPAIEGYPFQARIILPNVSATKDAGDKSWHWITPALTAQADIWSLHKVSFIASGKPQLSSEELGVVSDPLQGSVIFLEGRAAYIDFRTTNITINRTGKPPVIASFLKVNVLDPRSSVPKGGVAPVVDLGIHIKDLSSPGGKPLPLGKDIKVLTLEGTLFGKLNSGRVSEVLDAWQKAGGVFEIGNLNVEHGPLNLSAVGDVSLDAGLQPVGAFNARVQGFDETVSALSQKKIIGTSEAMMAKLVLGALAEKSVEGQRPSLKFPLSIQDQTLTAGPMKVMKLPKIIWD